MFGCGCTRRANGERVGLPCTPSILPEHSEVKVQGWQLDTPGEDREGVVVDVGYELHAGIVPKALVSIESAENEGGLCSSDKTNQKRSLILC